MPKREGTLDFILDYQYYGSVKAKFYHGTEVRLHPSVYDRSSYYRSEASLNRVEQICCEVPPCYFDRCGSKETITFYRDLKKIYFPDYVM